MHVGPSVTVTPPVKRPQIRAYFRYTPSVTAIASDITDNISADYGNFFVKGVSIFYKLIFLGVESWWGNGKYKFTFEDEDSYGWYKYSEKQKTKTSSTRFCLGF